MRAPCCPAAGQVFTGFRVAGGTPIDNSDQKKHRLKTKLQKLTEQNLLTIKNALIAADPTGGLKSYIKNIATHRASALAEAKQDLKGQTDITTKTQLFQVDKGIKPFSGTGTWSLLDDPWSTALQKAREFSRIMSFYEDGVDAAETTNGLDLKRVYRIESFLVGADRPFNFSNIKIVDFGIDMDNQIEGKLNANFSFEQFEVFDIQATPRQPESKANKSDSGVNILDLSVDFNPLVDDPIEVP